METGLSSGLARVSVGREIRSDFGWLWARTKRLADLLRYPNVLQGALDLANALDRYCEENGIREGDAGLGDAIFTRDVDVVEFPVIR